MKVYKRNRIAYRDTFKIRIPKELITERNRFCAYCPDAYGDMSDYVIWDRNKKYCNNEGTLMSEEETVSIDYLMMS